MQLHDLTTPREKAKGRVGRGIAAGQGKTAGRGTKGQKSRTGYKAPKRIPGMMSASDYRMPKAKGFNSHRPEVLIVTLTQIEAAYKAGETVSPDTLVAKNILKGYGKGGVKVVGTGTLTKKVNFENMKMTQTVSELVEKAGKVKAKEEVAETSTEIAESPETPAEA